MDHAWETALADLLTELSGAQQEMLDLLTEKRRLLAGSDLAGLTALAPREEQILARLQNCQAQRGDLLVRAKADGLPAANLRALTAALPGPRQRELEQHSREAAQRARLLAHHSLANWVVVQRTLLHLSQMLEIIATGGRLKPTYGKEPGAASSGSFVDQAA